MNQKNKHVVVVGCSRRIGLYVTQHLLESGFSVSGLYRTPSPELEVLAARHQNSLHLCHFDLRKLNDLDSLVSQITSKFGSLFSMIHVASQFYKTPFGEVTPEDWDELFDTNVKGQFFLTQALAPHLEDPSHIINLVDIFSFKPLKNYLAYTAAKGAFLTLTRNLADELAPKTRVNAISPGPVLLPDNFTDEEKTKHASRTLLGRTGEPSDIWNAIYFFLKSRYITGMNLCIDGGSSLA